MEKENRLGEEFLAVLRSVGEVIDEGVFYLVEVSPSWTLLLSPYPGGAEFRFERKAGESLIHSERFLLQERLQDALYKAGAPNLLELEYEVGSPFLLGRLSFAQDQEGLEKFRLTLARMLGAVDFVEACLEGKVAKDVESDVEETKSALTIAALQEGLVLDEVGPGKYTVADGEDPDFLWGRLEIARRLDNAVEATFFVLIRAGMDSEVMPFLSSLKDDMGFLRKAYDPWLVEPEAGFSWKDADAFLFRAVGERGISEEGLGTLLAHAASLWSYLSAGYRYGNDLIDPLNWKKAGSTGSLRVFKRALEDKRLEAPITALTRAVGIRLADYHQYDDRLQELEGVGDGFSFLEGDVQAEILFLPSSNFCPMVSYALRKKLPPSFDPRAIPGLEKELDAVNAVLPYASLSLEGKDGRMLVLRSHAVFPERTEGKWEGDAVTIVEEMMRSTRLLERMPSILMEERPWRKVEYALLDLGLYDRISLEP